MSVPRWVKHKLGLHLDVFSTHRGSNWISDNSLVSLEYSNSGCYIKPVYFLVSFKGNVPSVDYELEQCKTQTHQRMGSKACVISPMKRAILGFWSSRIALSVNSHATQQGGEVNICSLTFEDSASGPGAVCSRIFDKSEQAVLLAVAAFLQGWIGFCLRLPESASLVHPVCCFIQLPVQSHGRTLCYGMWQPLDNIMINSRRLGPNSTQTFLGPQGQQS